MNDEKFETVLLLGSNSGDRLHNIKKAINGIEDEIGPVTLKSSLYETSPWGFFEQPDFLNCVIITKTSLKPLQLLHTVKKIEIKLGRISAEKWQQRIIDIDILFYDSVVLTTKQLTIPHPLLHERKFTLIPLKEIMPDSVHPVFKKRIAELADNCKDRGMVKKMINDFTGA
jgi:2-amino-4-hydroxy-6-hydroxymethyldihydropteridine diphosphokinase